MPQKGMVFGVFDGLHEGHTYFLSEAAKLCEKLVVVVTLDETVNALKGHAPSQKYEERAKNVQALNAAFAVVPGDGGLGEWQVLKVHKPDVIILGYDQVRLTKEIRFFNIPYKVIGSHEPEKHKSSVQRGLTKS